MKPTRTSQVVRHCTAISANASRDGAELDAVDVANRCTCDDAWNGAGIVPARHAADGVLPRRQVSPCERQVKDAKPIENLLRNRSRSGACGTTDGTVSTSGSVPVELGNLISYSNPIPYEYRKLGLCHPQGGWVPSQATLGELVTGDKLWNSPFHVQMQVDQACQIFCMVKNVEQHPRKSNFVAELVRRNYRATVYVDRVPVSEIIGEEEVLNIDSLKNLTKHIGKRGVPLGHHNRKWDIDDTLIQTHFKFWIVYEPQLSTYSKNCLDDIFIPCLVEHKKEGIVPSKVVAAFVSSQSRTKPCRKKSAAQILKGNLVFTYEVSWVRRNRNWTRDWNEFTDIPKADSLRHWWALSYSLLTALCVAIGIALGLIYTLKVDVAGAKQGGFLPGSELARTMQNCNPVWKSVANNAFNPPPYCKLLFAMVGSGMQLLLLALLILFGCMVGVFRPSDWGNLVNAALRLFPCLGLVSGYQSAKLNGTFGGRDGLRLWVLTATFFPLLSFACYVFTDLLLWKEGSSGAVSFSTICRVFLFWIVLNSLSTFVGTYIAYRKPPRVQLEKQGDVLNTYHEIPWYRSHIALCFVFGLVPFLSSYLQVLHLLSSASFNQYANLFGFLFTDVFVMMLSCMEVSALVVFWTLRCGEHDWWWKAFLCPAASSLYMFIALSAYFATMHNLTRVALQVLLSQIFMTSLAFALVGGAAGFQTSYWLVNRLCTTLKPE